jgi:hypothetical protein
MFKHTLLNVGITKTFLRSFSQRHVSALPREILRLITCKEKSDHFTYIFCDAFLVTVRNIVLLFENEKKKKSVNSKKLRAQFEDHIFVLRIYSPIDDRCIIIYVSFYFILLNS